MWEIQEWSEEEGEIGVVEKGGGMHLFDPCASLPTKELDTMGQRR